MCRARHLGGQGTDDEHQVGMDPACNGRLRHLKMAPIIARHTQHRMHRMHHMQPPRPHSTTTTIHHVTAHRTLQRDLLGLPQPAVEHWQQLVPQPLRECPEQRSSLGGQRYLRGEGGGTQAEGRARIAGGRDGMQGL